MDKLDVYRQGLEAAKDKINHVSQLCIKTKDRADQKIYTAQIKTLKKTKAWYATMASKQVTTLNLFSQC